MSDEIGFSLEKRKSLALKSLLDIYERLGQAAAHEHAAKHYSNLGDYLYCVCCESEELHIDDTCTICGSGTGDLWKEDAPNAKQFRAYISIDNYDDDFSINDGEHMVPDDGSTVFALGSTPEEAWANLLARYRIGGPWGAQTDDSRFRDIFVIQTPKWVAARGRAPEGYDMDDKEYSPVAGHVMKSGCFRCSISGNQEFDWGIEPYIERAKEARVVEHMHGHFRIELQPNGSINICVGENPIVSIDNYYLEEENLKDYKPDDVRLRKPQVCIFTEDHDEAAITASVGKDNVFLTESESELLDDRR
jgi:hypothetical protein